MRPNAGMGDVARIALIVLTAAGLAGGILLVRKLAREPLRPPAPSRPAEPPPRRTAAVKKSPYTFKSNADCRDCHLEIWEEWKADQHSQAWFNTPFLPQDPKRTECNNCHAPEPVLEVGFEKLPIIRTARYEEGVGCIECHQNVDHVEGPLPTAEAACNPVHNKTFTDSRICNSCHAPHGTYDEWLASEWSKKGTTCQTCHMPEVERASSTGGPVRKARSHKMRTQRDITMLKESVTLDVKVDGGKIRITLANDGTGHNVPGEIFNREMFVRTWIYDKEGNQALDEPHRESIKTVKREQRATETSTQIKPGETRAYTYDLPIEHGKVRVEVRYKFLFLEMDDWAKLVHEKEIEF
ncbi:MAG: hypothetical protein HY716_02335 [Planctomycetes bacterium]|nr:hypothetical protein [Planctomycetota bacterium]